jgi:dipeptidase E
MGKIVALGGGELREGATRAIDARIVELSGKARPKALFIPTASGDAENYAETFRAQFGDELGCETDTLYLLAKRPALEVIAEKIQAADLIYVGGGNTLRMMKLWRRLGVDALLRQAYARGAVLSGISAGAICWFDSGHSDSRSFAAEGAWNYIRVRGLGLVDALYCPHIDAENRLLSFQQFVGKHRVIGLGCDDCCAFEIIDDTWRVIASREGAKAYHIYRQNGQVVTDILQPGSGSRPLADLLVKYNPFYAARMA